MNKLLREAEGFEEQSNKSMNIPEPVFGIVDRIVKLKDGTILVDIGEGFEETGEQAMNRIWNNG
jgi:hypothetical protein